MNSFCVYWVGKIPATAFLSSYLMGLRYLMSGTSFSTAKTA